MGATFYGYKGRSFIIAPYHTDAILGDTEEDYEPPYDGYVWQEIGGRTEAWFPHDTIEGCMDEIAKVVNGVNPNAIQMHLAIAKAKCTAAGLL